VEAESLVGLTEAFRNFTVATSTLEREYSVLQERLARMTGELEEKNRLLAASLERERRLEAEALRHSRLAAMGEMAAMLAHEVRNPLGAMELFTGLLLQDLKERPDAQRLAQQVARGIADLNHLVTNLLEFTRTQKPRSEMVDCCEVLENALRYTADLRAPGGIVVERHYSGPAVLALADPDLLLPVMTNLVRNALQAMGDGGTLRLEIATESRAVVLAVADTGPGIAPEMQEEIFRPFYTTRARGTGLGLAVVRGLVTAMGGRLEVVSQVGQGAAFTVRLPLALL